jgi:hypothetical protein
LRVECARLSQLVATSHGTQHCFVLNIKRKPNPEHVVDTSIASWLLPAPPQAPVVSRARLPLDAGEWLQVQIVRQPHQSGATLRLCDARDSLAPLLQCRLEFSVAREGAPTRRVAPFDDVRFVPQMPAAHQIQLLRLPCRVTITIVVVKKVFRGCTL